MATDGILLTGCTGQVGGELLRLLAPLGTVHAPTRAELDLADPASIRSYVRSVRPRWIINPGAYTAVDKAESEPAVAFAINAEAPRVFSEEARALGVPILHFSTDYVFPGQGTSPYTEVDPTGPLGVYGASKLAGEQALAASGAAHLIFRTSWVYGTTGKNFLQTVLRVAGERDQMNIVDDQHGAPTTSHDLAAMVLHVLTQCEAAAGTQPLVSVIAPLSGIYHAASLGESTWFGFASEALRLRRLGEPSARFAELVPIPSSAYPTPARRPHNSRLDTSKLHRTFGFQLPPWQQSLARVLSELA